MIILEHEMTEGDLCEYVRAQEQLAAIRTICARMPWRGKAMRHAQQAATQTLRNLAWRYHRED